MVKTVEIAPHILVDHLVDAVADEVWSSIWPYADDDQGLGVKIEYEKLRERLLRVLLRDCE
jgi:hypothetical protein